jgi:hypothetical protein
VQNPRILINKNRKNMRKDQATAKQLPKPWGTTGNARCRGRKREKNTIGKELVRCACSCHVESPVAHK